MRPIDMDGSIFEIATLQQKIQQNAFRKRSIRIGTFVCFVLVFIGTGTFPEHMLVGYIFSYLIYFGLFMFDCHITKKTHSYEFKIYCIRLKSLEDKKENARLKKQILHESVYNTVIQRPDEKIHYPVTYYAFYILLNVACIIWRMFLL